MSTQGTLRKLREEKEEMSIYDNWIKCDYCTQYHKENISICPDKKKGIEDFWKHARELTDKHKEEWSLWEGKGAERDKQWKNWQVHKEDDLQVHAGLVRTKDAIKLIERKNHDM